MPGPFDFADDSPIRRYDVTHRQGISAEGCFSIMLKGACTLVLLAILFYLTIPIIALVGQPYVQRMRQAASEDQRLSVYEKSNTHK